MAVLLHHFPLSGHAHRARLGLTLLGVPHTLVEVDLRARAQKTPEFLAKNSFGQVPVLEDGDVVLPDSNAILVSVLSAILIASAPSGTRGAARTEAGPRAPTPPCYAVWKPSSVGMRCCRPPRRSWSTSATLTHSNAICRPQSCSRATVARWRR